MKPFYDLCIEINTNQLFKKYDFSKFDITLNMAAKGFGSTFFCQFLV